MDLWEKTSTAKLALHTAAWNYLRVWRRAENGALQVWRAISVYD